MTEALQTRKTPLYQKHVKAGARMINFANFYMPLQYGGIIDEHKTVRNGAGIFDLSHMGEIEIRGDEAVDFVNYVITNDISILSPGGIHYTLICNPQGGILDDVLVYRMKDRILLVVNAANREKIYRWLLEHEFKNTRVVDLSLATALIAVQGPLAEKVLQKITMEDLSSIGYYRFVQGKILDCNGIISRTGYTGEDGFEIYVKNEYAEGVWDSLMVEGEEFGLKPIGLGARDTLRLEACYPLYGNEISEDVNPLEAGLKFAVKFKKENFIGRQALVEIKEHKPERKLIGIEMTGRGIPRKGYPVFNSGGWQIGEITSGTHSPTLKKPIGLALVKRGEVKKGDQVSVLIREKKVPGVVVKTPFYRGSVKKGSKQ